MAELPFIARFWMVCRKPTHRGAKTLPQKRYSQHSDAVAATQKLARENNHPYLILETVEIYHPNEAETQGVLL